MGNFNIFDGVTIINGHFINSSGFFDNSLRKDFDKIEKISASGVSRINVSSDIVNVKISACDTNNVTAHLYGSAIMDGDLKLSVMKTNDEITVCVKLEDSSSNISTFGSSNIITDKLIMDINIPNETFELLFVESKNGSIEIAPSVNTNNLTIVNSNGSTNVLSSFQALNIEHKNGSVKVDSKAYCDVALSINCANGGIDVSLENIGTSNVTIDSLNGTCNKNPRLTGKYTSYGHIRSVNGSISLK